MSERKTFITSHDKMTHWIWDRFNLTICGILLRGHTSVEVQTPVDCMMCLARDSTTFEKAMKELFMT